MKKSEAVKALAVMTAIWPQRDMTRATAEQYSDAILDLPPEAVAAAIERLKLESDWLPSIASLRKAAVDAMPGEKVPDADQAWEEVHTAFGTVGQYKTPTWSHPAIAQTVRAMGWKEMCQSENVEATRAHFKSFYGDGAKRAQLDAVMTPKGRELMEGLSRSIGRELPA